MKTVSLKTTRGFTLMESVIAIGIVAVLLTTFLAVFGPATQSIQRALSAQEADRLQSALEAELQKLREGTDSSYNSAFEKAFDWIKDSGKVETAVLLYNYRGNPNDIRSDGSLEPYTGEEGQSGRDFILQPAARRRGDANSDMEDDFDQVEGSIYYVRMTQLIFDPQNGALTPGEHGTIVNMHDEGDAATDIDDYPGGMIAFSADFYPLKSNNLEYIKNLDLTDGNDDGQPDKLGRPLFSRNLGVRR